MQIIVKKLCDRLQEENFNNMNGINDYQLTKLLCAISDLCTIINDAIWDYQQGIEYEYRVYDSF